MGIGDQVDFRREPASRPSECLHPGPPFAPAAWQWAQMTVPSSNTHSVSASRGEPPERPATFRRDSIG
jgi:hypothetical protein